MVKRRVTIDFSEDEFKQMWIEKGPNYSWKQFLWLIFVLDRDQFAAHNWCGNCKEDYPKRIAHNKKLYEKKYGDKK